jgi:phage gpG-like protein
MAIKFHVKGLNKAKGHTHSMQSTLGTRMRGVNLSAIVVLSKWVQRNFQAEGGLHNNNYGPWKPLAQSTIKNRRKGSSTILQDTGRLRTSFSYKATAKGATLSNNVKYAKIHEEGKGRVPQRKIFPTFKQAEEIVQPVYEKFIERITKP